MPFLPPNQQRQSTEGNSTEGNVLIQFWLIISIVHCMVPHHLTWRRHSLVSPTCRTDAGSGPPPPNSLTFRPVVGQLSEVVPFLSLEQRCGMASQAMLRRPRRCRCSRTGRRHTCSAAVTKLFDLQLHSPFSQRDIIRVTITSCHRWTRATRPLCRLRIHQLFHVTVS